MGKHSNEKRKIHWGILIFRLISLIIILLALNSIWNWYKENKENDMILKQVSEDIINVDVVPTENGPSYQLLNIDFNSLLSKNSDTVGWICIPNTSANYSIVKSSDNDFYLTHSFNKSENSAGWIFMDYRCNSDFSSKNTIIYGHNRKNGSMFGTIKNMLKADWYDNNSYITIATPSGNRIYQVFSMYKVPAETYYTSTGFSSDSEYETFLSTICKRSIHNFNVNLTSEDSIITLSTCSGTNNARTVVHAKLVEIK